jgi:Berberine and berberine like
MWSEAAEDEKNVRWVREFWNAMQPLSSDGFYPNYDADADLDRVRSAYGPAKHERLVALKRKYDSANLFRLNQNIKPAG